MIYSFCMFRVSLANTKGFPNSKIIMYKKVTVHVKINYFKYTIVERKNDK